MKIVLTATGTSGAGGTPVGVVLGDDGNKEFIVKGSYRFRMELQTQTVGGPRWDTMLGFARKNCQIPLSWSTSRSLETYALALKFIHDHAVLLRRLRKGDIAVSQEGPSGFTCVYTNAILQALEVVSHDGVNVVMRYQFWAPDITTSAT